MAWDQKCCRALYQSSPASPGCGALHIFHQYKTLLQDISTTSVWPNSGGDYAAFESSQPLCSKYFQGIFLIHCCITRLTEHCAFLLLRQALRVNSVHAARRITSVKQLQCGNPLFSIKPVTFLHVPRWAVDEATLVSAHYGFDITVSFLTGFASAQVRPSAHEETLWRVNPSRSGYCIVVNEVGHILPRHLCNPVKTLRPPSNHFTLVRRAVVCFMAISNHYCFLF